MFLRELIHIYGQTYFSLDRIKNVLRDLVLHAGFVGNDPATFWRNLDVLDIQQKGTSQSDLRTILAEQVEEVLGVEISEHDTTGRHSLYIDDAIFSGNSIVNDVTAWLGRTEAPAKLSVMALDVSDGGSFSIERRLGQQFNIAPKIWHSLPTRNKSNSGASADVFRLREYPTDERSTAYLMDRLGGGPAALLRGTQANTSERFTSEGNRDLTEKMLWEAGLTCLNQCTNFSTNVRPLGYCSANGQNKLGFGSQFASYRNIPNNAPVALWAGNPWIPLLRRRTNG